MPNMSAQALRTAVINAAISDVAFRDELAKDAGKAIEARFGSQSLAPRVEFEKENDLSILIPQKTDQLSKAIDRVVADVGTRSPTRGEFEAMVVQRAWSNGTFLTELRRDATAAINAALAQYGSNVPSGASVRLYEEQPGECQIVVPRPPSANPELSDAELEAVAGGEGVAIALTGAIVGAIASKVVDEIWEAC